MKTSGVIQFQCPACQVRLTVPASMAGVSGPCPRCSATIAAPEVDGPAPLPVASAATPASPPAPVEAAPEKEPEDTSRIQPQPRSRPGRQNPIIAPVLSTDDESLRRPQQVESRKRNRPRPAKRSLIWILAPGLFILAIGSLVFFLLYQFYPKGPVQQLRASRAPLSKTPLPKPLIITPKAAPDTEPKSSITIEPEPTPVTSPLSALDGIEAGKVLDRFISASTIATRLELIDPPLSTIQIKDTLAAKKMPEVINISSVNPDYDPIEKVSNFPFRITFRTPKGDAAEYLVLVRKRGEGEPKVAIEPFLDLVGGRLAEFSSKPRDRSGTFQVVLEPLKHCFEENIPNADRKITYKLFPCDVGDEIARAYVSKQSSMAKLMEDPRSGLSEGKPLRATVEIEWNTTEDPENPYLEMVAIKCLNWNP